MPFGHTPASWSNTIAEQVCDYRADGRCALPDAQLPKSTILPWGNPSATVAFLLTRAEARQLTYAKWEERTAGTVALMHRAHAKLRTRLKSENGLAVWVHVADSGRDQLPLPVHPPWGVTLSTVGARDAAADFWPDYSVCGWRAVGFDADTTTLAEFAQSLVLAGLLPARAPLRPQAFFAGNARWHPVRALLVNQSREMPEWLDVRDVATDAAGGVVDAATAVPFADAAKWEVLLDVPGGGWSGRLKFLPLLGRPLVVIDRREWDWVSGAVLRPYEHYRPVAATTRGPGNGVDTKYSLDIDDLFAQLAWVRNNAHEAAMMAERARRAVLDALHDDAVDAQAARVLARHAAAAMRERPPDLVDGSMPDFVGLKSEL